MNRFFKLKTKKILLIILFPIFIYSSTLSDAATSLSAGESIKIKTNNLTTAGLDGGISFLTWSNTANWCPIRKKVVYIGKQAGSYRHYRLEYDEATNTWDKNGSLHSSLETPGSGHGYDGNALDPITGNIYFRRYNDESVYRWTRSTDTWSKLSNVNGSIDIAEAIEWWAGRGLIWSDVYSAQLYTSSWATITTSISGIGYHSVGEVQPNADIYVFGGGNAGSRKLYRLEADNTLSTLESAPISLGNAGSNGQGLLVYDPASDYYIAWDRVNSWYQFDAVTDEWNQLTQSSGNGSSAQTGTPNYSNGNSVAVPIPEYDVIMFFGAESNDVWIYKHKGEAVDRPKAPQNPKIK